MSLPIENEMSLPMAKDMISSLPDSILYHILSFIPTKLAANTCLLSKRWNPLWLSTLTLNFDDETFKNFITFSHFIYLFLLSRDSNLPILSFSLKCRNSLDFIPHDLVRILRLAMQRGQIQNLQLDLNNINTWKLSHTTFLTFLTCETLVVLKLKNIEICDIPHKVNLPLLKTLHLTTIGFHHPRFFQDLIFGCPILEDLHLKHVGVNSLLYGDDLNGKLKDLPKLVTAKIYCSVIVPFNWVHTAKFLCAELRGAYQYQVPTFHNLIHMELFINHKKCPNLWNWLMEVLQHCPKLQNLIIHEVPEGVILTQVEDFKDPETVPECLSSQLKTFMITNYRGIKSEFQFAEYIMKNSEVLSTMTIKTGWKSNANEKLQMLVDLSMCPRVSGRCRLLFG